MLAARVSLSLGCWLVLVIYSYFLKMPTYSTPNRATGCSLQPRAFGAVTPQPGPSYPPRRRSARPQRKGGRVFPEQPVRAAPHGGLRGGASQRGGRQEPDRRLLRGGAVLPVGEHLVRAVRRDRDQPHGGRLRDAECRNQRNFVSCHSRIIFLCLLLGRHSHVRFRQGNNGDRCGSVRA